jgi:Protein of unknown function (DUF3987)
MSANPLLSQPQLVPASPQIIGEKPNASVTPPSDSEVQKMEHLFRWGRIQHLPPVPWNGGHQWRVDRCVFNPNHRDVFVGVNALGETFYTCSNDACHENHWNQFIELVKQKSTPEAQIARIEEETRQKEEPDLPESTQAFPPFPRLIGVLDELASAIAPSLAYEQKALALLTGVGLKIAGRVKLATDPWLQTRFYSVSISPPGQTKSAADKEVRRALWPQPLNTHESFETTDDNPNQMSLGQQQLYPHPPLEGTPITVEFSVNSGPALVQLLSESPRVFLAPDELAGMFEKARSTSSSPNTLFNELLRLYEGNETGRTVVARRGEKGAHLKLTNVYLAIYGGATPQSFERMWRGTGGDGAGLQSRFTIAYSDCPLPAFQTLTDGKDLQRLMPILNSRLRAVPENLTMTDEAQTMAIEWVAGHKEGLPARALDTAKRAAMILASTLEVHCIDAQVMRWALDFAEYQMVLKKRLMPADADNNVQAFEHKIVGVFEHNYQATLAQVRRAIHPERHSGGHESYNRAVTALIRSGRLMVASKTPLGTQVYKLG